VMETPAISFLEDLQYCKEARATRQLMWISAFLLMVWMTGLASVRRRSRFRGPRRCGSIGRIASIRQRCFLSSAVSGLKIEQIESNRRVGITRYFVKDWSFNYSVPKGMWTHLAFVAGDGVTRLYVNGLLEDSIPATVPLPLTEMGKRTLAVPGGAFKGILDEVIVFNRALRSDEILQIYGSSRSGLCKPPIFEPINGQALAFHVIGPVGKRLAFSESRDLRTWTPSFTTNNPGGTIDISLVPTNSGAVFLRAQTME
jgi:hypothetical protein